MHAQPFWTGSGLRFRLRTEAGFSTILYGSVDISLTEFPLAAQEKMAFDVYNIGIVFCDF